MSITREAAAALADLHAANPLTRDVAGTWQEDAVAYVAALWDAEVGRAAKEGTCLPAFASHTAGMRRLIATVVAAAHKVGVPVMAYDRLILDSDLDLYVSFDNMRVG